MRHLEIKWLKMVKDHPIEEEEEAKKLVTPEYLYCVHIYL